MFEHSEFAQMLGESGSRTDTSHLVLQIVDITSHSTSPDKHFRGSTATGGGPQPRTRRLELIALTRVEELAEGRDNLINDNGVETTLARPNVGLMVGPRFEL